MATSVRKPFTPIDLTPPRRYGGPHATRSEWPWHRSLRIRWGLLYIVQLGLHYGYPVQWIWLSRRFGAVIHPVSLLFVSDATFARYPFQVIYSTYALVGLVLAAIWVALDRRRRHEEALNEVFRLSARYLVGSAMIAYGMAKVFPGVQVQPPGPNDWVRPFGEMKGGELMWAWIGYSPSFEVFAGGLEVVGGILLLIPRTILLGAILCMAAGLNVGIVCWGLGDFQGGSYALQYAIVATFLIAADWRRLFGFFLADGASPPPRDQYQFTNPLVRKVGFVVKTSLIASFIYLNGVWDYRQWMAFGAKWTLEGVYSVEEFSRNGTTEPIALKYPKRWRVVGMGRKNVEHIITIRTVDDSQLQFLLPLPDGPISRVRIYTAPDTPPDGTLTLQDFNRKPGATETKLHYVRTANGDLTVNGRVGSDSISARLRLLPSDTFHIYNRHWRGAAR